MNGRKARDIYKVALSTYSYKWLKTMGMTFKNYYRKLKDEYVRGDYGKD